jgi:hypothetical protein
VRPFSGRITLFRSLESSQGADPTLGWERFAAAGLEIHSLQAPHREMVREPYVEQLAGILTQCIQRAT